MKNLIALAIIALGLWFVIAKLNSGNLSEGGATSGAPEGFLTHYEDALAQSKLENKPVVLVFSASWCPPCRQMKKEVYPSPQVAAFKDQFVWAYLDVDQTSNRSAAAKYRVQGIPHVQFLSPDGTALGKLVGGTSATAFANQLESVLASSK